MIGDPFLAVKWNKHCQISLSTLKNAGCFIKLLSGKKPFLELRLKAVLRHKCGNFIRPDIPAKRIPRSRI